VSFISSSSNLLEKENIMSAEDEVREASKQNGVAMNLMLKGDASKLPAIWSHSASVTTMHPIGGREVGWDAVWASFENFAKLATDGSFELKDQYIHVAGNVAYEVGVEHVNGKLGGHPYAIEQRVTNIYQREAGVWQMIHHHSEVSPVVLEVLGKLQPQ
jgi:ketosteroid isomerase-like protein